MQRTCAPKLGKVSTRLSKSMRAPPRPTQVPFRLVLKALKERNNGAGWTDHGLYWSLLAPTTCVAYISNTNVRVGGEGCLSVAKRLPPPSPSVLLSKFTNNSCSTRCGPASVPAPCVRGGEVGVGVVACVCVCVCSCVLLVRPTHVLRH